MIKLASKTECTGCAACVAICPCNNITMISDPEGFLYPVLLDHCVECHKCEKICPVINKPNLQSIRTSQSAFCALHKDENIWSLSSSGGAFSAICENWGDEDTIIFGAKFDEQNEVVHDFIKGVGNIAPFRRSKYVQSRIENIYEEVKSNLEIGRKVIFSGVPCQVAALRNFLGDKYLNSKSLLCVDLMCMGVGSPAIFAKYLMAIEEKFKSKIIEFSFRNRKVKHGSLSIYGIKITFSNGIVYENAEDLYNSLFIQKTICRRSCYACIFANLDRMGDITIADFKNLYDIFPKLKTSKNHSAIIVNTSTGANVMQSLSSNMDIYPCSMQVISKIHFKSLNYADLLIEKRSKFFQEYIHNSDIIFLLKRYKKRRSMLLNFWIMIPERYRACFKRWVKNGKA